ncbi:tRNA dimethylallyltransferase [Enterococcus florum]|uniref:tRNA dimethylallyltransferase n=1 Tax=Enterococcus florum TaxID=2480627 RepID=A0A4P5P9U4_9ENTE|nr:tRNA (adenosine(37)-N6)-dimethylallyltransferase MiaA [Enterococcus florum]GCF92262.1 tRNA dimethylallyltransferase [Enterococcus florum]
MKKVLAIVGPTAVGKTSLSIELAKRLNGEIISGDSMQVYRTLDIGTAKVTKKEMSGIPHHLIDIKEVTEGYSVSEFQATAREVIATICSRGKLPIVVGGTGLYIQSLLWDYKLGNERDQQDPRLRRMYEAYAKEHGKEALWRYLAERDPLAAQKIHLNNQKKVIRALEVFELTGRSIMVPEKEPKLLYDAYLIGLDTKRELLYARIDQRVESMLESGILDEARSLYKTPTVQAAQGIGYKEFFPYFAGEISLEEAAAVVQQQSRRYAKRQLTWFRNRMDVHWYDLVQHPEDISQIISAAKCWLEEGSVCQNE